MEDKDLQIKNLEKDLQEAHLKIERICHWIQLIHGLIIPADVLEPITDPNPKQDFNNEIFQEDPSSAEFCTNEWINSDPENFVDDVDIEEFKYENAVSGTSDNSTSTFSDSTILCKPCLVVLPRIIGNFNDQMYKRKRIRITKLIPSQEQRTQAQIMYHNYHQTLCGSTLQCPICTSSFTSESSTKTKSQFKRHLLNLHYFNEEELNASLSVKVTVKNTIYGSRSKIKPTEEEKQKAKEMCRDYFYECDLDSIINCPVKSCNRNFQFKVRGKKTREAFKRHLKMVHFFTSDELLNQNNLRTNNTSRIASTEGQLQYKKISCSICHKYFRFRSSLLAHIKFIHEGQPQENYQYYRCSICNALVSSKCALQNHIRSIHRKEKDFIEKEIKMSSCGLESISTSVINHTTRTRSKIKPTEEEKQKAKDMCRDFFYECDLDSIINCPVKFCLRNFQFNKRGKKTREAFKRHLKMVHFFTSDELLANNLRTTNTSRTASTESERLLRYKKISCSICNKYFRFRSSLLAHIKFIHEGQPQENYRYYRCSICNALVSSKYALQKHIRSIHQKEKNFIEKEIKVSSGVEVESTSVINLTARSKIKPTDEEREQAKDMCRDFYKCQVGSIINCPVKSCRRQFIVKKKKTREAFKRHLKMVHFFTPDELLLVNVNNSTTSTSTTASVSSTSGVKDPVPVKKTIKFGVRSKIKPTDEERQQAKDMCRDFFYECDVDSIINCPVKSCRRNFQFIGSLNGRGRSTREAFKRHLVMVHFFNNDELHVKILKTTNNPSGQEEVKKKIKCHICYKVFKFRTSLMAHIKFIHEGHRPDNYRDYKCNICNTSISTKGGLRLHIQSIHQQERNFLCSYCPRTFSRSETLKGHIRTHTGEKPYKCDKCNADFMHNSALHSHTIRYHYSAEDQEKLKIYICDKCPEKFRLLCHLKKHQEIVHDEVRRYSCPEPECGISFKTLDHLRSHNKKVHLNPNVNRRRRKSKKIF